MKPEPEWDDASVASALDHAVTIIEAFNRPDLDYDTWWQGFAPLMDYDAQITYANVDPANAPALKVTGDATLEDPKSAYVANVTVPTSVGTWGVLMLRADAESPWLGERIEFPEGIH